MPDFAYVRVVAGQPMPGVFVIHDRMAVRQVIDELLILTIGFCPAPQKGKIET